jgi:hypothetical protein
MTPCRGQLFSPQERPHILQRSVIPQIIGRRRRFRNFTTHSLAMSVTGSVGPLGRMPLPPTQDLPAHGVPGTPDHPCSLKIDVGHAHGRRQCAVLELRTARGSEGGV